MQSEKNIFFLDYKDSDKNVQYHSVHTSIINTARSFNSKF